MGSSLRKLAEELFGLSYLDEIRLYPAIGVVEDKMIPAIKEFFTDETVFIRFCRAIIAYLGFALHDGSIPYLNGPGAWWAGPVITMFAFMLGAGDRNQPPGVIKAMANDPSVPVTRSDIKAADAAKITPPGA